jgi:hypothetical protein
MGLVKLLQGAGFSVQLKHVEAESDDTRDRVCLKNDKGEELGAHADMQHNKNYYKMEENAKALFETARAKMAEAVEVVEASTETATEATIFTKAAEAAEVVTDTTAPAEAVNA